MGRVIEPKVYLVRINKKLYEEIIYAQTNLQEKQNKKPRTKKKVITFTETTEKLGEYLNSLRKVK